jgi:DNA repair exonuclease SbcCD ATPase subunit
MLTLKMQIDHAQKQLRMIQERLTEQEHLIRELEDLRADCRHEWDGGVKGYEHEGRTCKLCGINELYAPTHKKQVEARSE